MTDNRTVDIVVEDQGSIVQLVPMTDAGTAWLTEHIGADNGYQPYWPVVLCEPRYVEAIVEGMVGAGLVVSSSEERDGTR